MASTPHGSAAGRRYLLWEVASFHGTVLHIDIKSPCRSCHAYITSWQIIVCLACSTTEDNQMIGASMVRGKFAFCRIKNLCTVSARIGHQTLSRQATC